MLLACKSSKNASNWTISSQATLEVEGSTTISQESRAQEGSKRTAPLTGDDIVSSVLKDTENQWNRLVRKKTTVAGRPRKESVYDTDVWANSQAIPSQITLFQNFTAFSIAPGNTSITKQFGRFLNKWRHY